MCLFITKQTTELPLFEPALTPRNAKEKGYNFIDDIIFDLINQSEAMKDIFEFIRKFHCKLGVPANTTLDHCFGLYIPIQS